MKTFIFKHSLASDNLVENKFYKYFVNNSSRFYSTSFTFAKFIKSKIYSSLNIFYNIFALKLITTSLRKIKMI